jgi:[acyl-carrier-protein] S-malonyltransferase
MQSVAEEFRQTLAKINFQAPRVPVYANVSAQPITSVQAIREELDRQLTQSVRWTESVQAMIAAGAERFVEFGPGDVLSGLLKRIDRSKTGVSLNSVSTLQSFIQSNL